ncbi:MAG: DUF5719 family protein [Acidobacteriota bacterium]
MQFAGRADMPATGTSCQRAFFVFITFIGLLGIGGSWAFPASRLIFPRASFDIGTITGIALVNPTGQDAQVTLTLRGPDGSLLTGTGITNPARFTVGKGKQLAQLLDEWFHAKLPADRVGWVEVTSPRDGITGFFLFLNLAGTQFDGADLPEAAPEIIFNQIEAGESAGTELNLVNPGSAGTEVTLRLVGPSVPPASKTINLPAGGMARLDASQFFGLTQIPNSCYVRVIAKAPVAGFEFVKSSKGDLIGLNAQHERLQLSDIYFPQMAVQGPWKTEIGLVNYTASPVILTITAFQADGTKFGTDQLNTNPVTRSLDKFGAMRADVAELFGFKGDQVRDGWIQVTASSPSINGYIRYGLPETGSVALVAAPAEGTTRALFSHIATVSGFFTGLALLNPGSVVANVRVMAFTSAGTPIGTYDTALAPGHRISKLINELIQPAGNQSGGFIWVKSDRPIYSTSLFGTSKVLANIPPQGVPSAFNPDSGTQSLKLDPPLAAVQPKTGLKFQVTGSAGAVVWKVNGKQGGDNVVGRIAADGTYTAPENPPSPQSVTISAEVGGRIVGAAVDIVKKEQLFSGLGVVQAVAYLASLRKLYESELVGLSPTDQGGDGVEPAAGESRLFELLPGNVKVPVSTFANEEIHDMTAFAANGGKEYMLLAARRSGRILRLDPENPQQPYEVAKGLVQPGAMVIDPVSGNLLVAEQDRITTISRSALEAGLRTTTQRLGKRPRRRYADRGSLLVGGANASSLAVDECTGNVYYTDNAAGTINVYSKATGETFVAADGLLGPTDLLAVYRQGVSCPAALNLLVVERDQGWVTLVLPYSGQQYIWFEVPSAFDVTFLPENNPFTEAAGVLIGQFADENAELFFVDLPDDYGVRPTNGLTQSLCVGSVFLADPDLERVIRTVLDLGPNDLISCELAQQLIGLTAPTQEILFLDGIEFFPLMQDLRLEDNYILDLEPLRQLPLMDTLDLSDNLLFDIEPLWDLDMLRQLDVSNNLISDVSPLINLWDLEYIDLSGNLIDDIDSLVFNFGLGPGDFIDLRDNLLDLGDCRGIQQLEIQGVQVETDVPCDLLPKGDVGVYITADPDPVPEDGVLRYTVDLTNWKDSSDATSVLFVDLLPGQAIPIAYDTGGLGECESFEDVLLVCYFDWIDPYSYIEFTFDVQVLGLPGDVLENYAWTSAGEYDEDPKDNSVIVSTAISP